MIGVSECIIIILQWRTRRVSKWEKGQVKKGKGIVCAGTNTSIPSTRSNVMCSLWLFLLLHVPVAYFIVSLLFSILYSAGLFNRFCQHSILINLGSRNMQYLASILTIAASGLTIMKQLYSRTIHYFFFLS